MQIDDIESHSYDFVTPRRSYIVTFPDGDYVSFMANLDMNWDVAELHMSHVEILERGNLYDRQGSD